MTLNDEAVLSAIREWYNQKPASRRIISRRDVETLLDLPAGDSPERKRTRQIISAVCNTRLERYSVCDKTRSWVVTAEALA